MSRLPRYDFAGAAAFVTGAASGIGEQLALDLARRGSAMVLLDRDDERLVAVAERARRSGVRVDCLVADLAETHAIPEIVERVHALAPQISLVINNAGVALGGSFAELTADEFDWVMAINFAAPVAICRGMVPHLRAGSHVVNVSSVFGLIAPAGQSAYAASKFALRGFSEALRNELLAREIGVTTVHPGGIKTRIARSARVGVNVCADQAQAGKKNFDRMLRYPADKTASQILDAVHIRKTRQLIAASAHIPDLLARAFPQGHAQLLARLQGAAGQKSDT